MNILIDCEESQRVCTEFRNKGHECYSADLQECSGGHPEWHIKGDCISLINGNCEFKTEDGKTHRIDGKWDMIIAHPPCTYLCSTGQVWCNEEKWGDKARVRKLLREEAVEFFMKFVNANCDKIAIENPVGIMSTRYKKPSVIYNPYDFIGETECKKTCLWIKGMPILVGTREEPIKKEERTLNGWKAIFDGKQYAWNDKEVGKLRSKTPIGVAKAMAEQWG